MAVFLQVLIVAETTADVIDHAKADEKTEQSNIYDDDAKLRKVKEIDQGVKSMLKRHEEDLNHALKRREDLNAHKEKLEKEYAKHKALAEAANEKNDWKAKAAEDALVAGLGYQISKTVSEIAFQAGRRSAVDCQMTVQRQYESN